MPFSFRAPYDYFMDEDAPLMDELQDCAKKFGFPLLPKPPGGQRTARDHCVFYLILALVRQRGATPSARALAVAEALGVVSEDEAASQLGSPDRYGGLFGALFGRYRQVPTTAEVAAEVVQAFEMTTLDLSEVRDDHDSVAGGLYSAEELPLSDGDGADGAPLPSALRGEEMIIE